MRGKTGSEILYMQYILNECQQIVRQDTTTVRKRDQVPVNHNHAHLLEVFGDSLRLEMPCLLAVDSDNTSLRLLILNESAKKRTTTV